jgi:CheY-like chemotaxis protein
MDAHAAPITPAENSALSEGLVKSMQMEKALHHILAMLAHELRNPLAAILNATQVLASERSDRDLRREATQVIRRQADQMARLLDDLLDVTRIATLPRTTQTSTASTTPAQAGTTCKVLIIEDNADSRRMLERILKLDGYEVHTAENGDQGLQEILRLRPRFALVDIGLPGLDGYQVARKVRETLSPDEVFLIALTGYGRPKDRQAVKEAGFDEHLIKPLNPDELARVMQKSRQ